MHNLPGPSYYEPPDYDEPQVDFSFTRTQRAISSHKCTTCQRIIPKGSLTQVTFERVEGINYYLRTCTGIHAYPAYNCNIIAGPISRIGYLVIGDDTVTYYPQSCAAHATYHESTLSTQGDVTPISYANRNFYG